MSDGVRLDLLMQDLHHYQSRSFVIQHVSSLLDCCRSLIPKVQNYVFNDGRTVRLLGLEGTVPILYRNNNYNIPVKIWISETYPSSPPMCYVNPTFDMRIKDGHKHVDPQGFVYMPYLSQWNTRSTLIELVQQMSLIFGQDPPVFKAQPPAQNMQQFSNVVQNPSSHAQYPAATQNFPQAQQSVSHGYPVQQGMYTSQGSHAYSYRQQQNIAEPSFHQPLIHQPQDQKSILITKLNSRVCSALEEFMRISGKEINELFERQSELKKGSHIIQNGITSMEKEKNELQQRLDFLKAESMELEKWLQSNENNEEPVHLGDLVKPKDTWSRQMFEVVSRDFAIEDTLYVLDRALADDRINLTDFLKKIRTLARDQYFARALGNKIEEKQAAAMMSI